MATTTLLDLWRTDPVCEQADRSEKQELVARQDLLISHSTLETFDSDPGLRAATEASDDESCGEWDGGHACGERVLTGKGHAEPIFQPLTEETLSPARSRVDKAAARLMICEGRVVNAKRELQRAEAWWRIASLRMKLKALEDAESVTVS